MKIYNTNNALLKDIAVNDRSYRIKEIMGENALYLYYKLAEHLELPVGAYVTFKGEKYQLLKSTNFKKQHTRHWEYTVKLESYQAFLAGVKYKFFAGTARNFKLQFPLVMQPKGFLKLLVDNMNIGDSGWTVGECKTADEKLITFDDESCQQALRKIADAFHTEFEVVGKTIHLRKVERTASPALPLSYGKNKGLKPGVGRSNFDNTKIINRLYVKGSERNIDSAKYGNSTLLLPKSKTITYSGVEYITDAHGTYLEKKGLTGARIESSVDLTHIYPSRVGTVSEVVVVDATKHFYDIKDTSIPATLNYTENLIPGGEKMKLVFQTGALAGIEFEVTYKHDEKRFKIAPKEEHGLTYPTAPDLPSVGDKYAIFGIYVPGTYTSSASNRMLDEAVKALHEGGTPQYTISGELDDVFATKNWQNIESKIQIGQLISFTDENFSPTATLLRITSVRDFVNKPKKPKLQFANKVQLRTFGDELAKLKTNIHDGAYSEVLKNNMRLKDVFLFKNAPDTANSHIKFKDGITADVTILSKLKSETFNSGLLGEGFMLQKNDTGNWNLELDNLVVRKNMDVFRLTIQEIKSVGGQLLLSPASMRVTKVEETTNTYKCFFNNDSGNISNPFTVGDQAICQQFNGSGQKRYWRLVTAVGTDYIELSKTDKDGTGVPAKNDEIVQLGHRTDAARQNAILISSYGVPKIEQYKGINTYSTAGKLVTRISPEGNLFRAINFVVETANKSGYLKLENGTLKLKGSVEITSDSPAYTQIANQQDPKISTAKQQAISTSSTDATSKANIAKAQAEAKAKELVDAVEIGGRNLLLNSNIFGVFESLKTINLAEPLIVGKTYTLSFVAKKERIGNGWVSVQQPNNWEDKNLNVRVYIFSSEFQKYNATFVAKESVNQKLWIYSSGNYAINLKEKSLKLEKGTRATDWSPAPEDVDAEILKAKQQAIAEANSKIAQAKTESKTAWENYANLKSSSAQQSAIDTAKAFALAKDNEKETIVKSYADGKITTAEQNAINVATAKATLAETNAKAWADGKITAEEQARILADRQKLAQAEAKAKELIDAIEIGGRNLLLNSNIFGVFESPKTINLAEPLIVGKTYTLSFVAKKERIGNGWVSVQQPNNWEDKNLNVRVYIFSSEFQKYNATFVAKESVNQKLWIYSSGNYAINLKEKSLKLEKGTRATDWSPAPEDVDAEILKAKQQAIAQAENARIEAVNAKVTADRLNARTNFLSDTKINGNTVATGTLQVGNLSGANAGITGQGTGNSVRAYFGADFNNRNSAPTRITNNGDLFSKKAVIEGEINAKKGKIGYFQLQEGKLSSKYIHYPDIILHADPRMEYNSTAPYSEHIELSPNKILLKRSEVSGDSSIEISPAAIKVDGQTGYTGSFGIEGAYRSITTFNYKNGILISVT